MSSVEQHCEHLPPPYRLGPLKKVYRCYGFLRKRLPKYELQGGSKSIERWRHCKTLSCAITAGVDQQAGDVGFLKAKINKEIN